MEENSHVFLPDINGDITSHATNSDINPKLNSNQSTPRKMDMSNNIDCITLHRPLFKYGCKILFLHFAPRSSFTLALPSWPWGSDICCSLPALDSTRSRHLTFTAWCGPLEWCHFPLLVSCLRGYVAYLSLSVPNCSSRAHFLASTGFQVFCHVAFLVYSKSQESGDMGFIACWKPLQAL